MSIIKSKHAGNYTVVPNALIKDSLALDSLGLLVTLLSMSHDWVIYKSTLHKQLKCGREKIDRMFKELQDKGYILTTEVRNNKGRIEYSHIVYDKPYNGEPYTIKPSTGFPSTDSQPLINTNIISNNKTSKNKITNNRFEEFWNLYEKKVGKKETEYQWDKLTEEEQKQAIASIPAYKYATPDPKYRKDPSRYLKHKRWEDVHEEKEPPSPPLKPEHQFNNEAEYQDYLKKQNL